MLVSESEKPESLRLSVNVDPGFVASEFGLPATVFETSRTRASPQVRIVLWHILISLVQSIHFSWQEKAALHNKAVALQTKLQAFRQFRFTVVPSSPVSPRVSIAVGLPMCVIDVIAV
jgi:hypothetical protein